MTRFRGLRSVATLLLLWIVATAAFAKKREPIDLVNVRLGPAYSQWLVGATGELASEKEIERYLELRDDAAAERFIEEFWAARADEKVEEGTTSMRAAVGLVDNPLRELYEERAEEADKLYSEAGYLGRRTARGTIHVLFGPPDETDYDVNPDPYGEPISVWTYDRSKRRGLDGRKPEKIYRFIRQGDLTVPYVPSLNPRPVRRF